MTKSGKALEELLKHRGKLKTRGEAYKVLHAAGLTGSGTVFNKAVDAYQLMTDEKLVNSSEVSVKAEKKRRRQQMAAEQASWGRA